MINKQVLSKVSILLLFLGLMVIGISNRGCPKRSRDRGGSSNEIFRITAPSNLTATAVSPYQINLSWQDNSTTPPEDGFEIWRSLDGENWGITQIATTNANMTSYSDSGLIRITIYYYRVRAFNNIGDRSEWSNVASALTLRPTISPVAAGTSHSIFRTTEGIIYTWGVNAGGQLGLGDSNNRSVPTLVELDYAWNVFDNIAVIAAGAYHNIIIKRDGTSWVWGQNEYGQLGLGDTVSATVPFPIWGTDSDWSLIASGYSHNLGLKTNGTLWAWGYNSGGQLGQGDTGFIELFDEYGVPRRTTPTQISIESDWLAFGCGGYHSFGIKTNNTIWSWGENQYGQLGLGDSVIRSTPTQIGTAVGWLAVTGGGAHSLGLKSNGIPDSQAGMLWAWGSNNYGQLGDGTITNRYTPRQIGTESGWFAFAGGSFHSLGGKVNGTIWSWGDNRYGQLGLGDAAPLTITIPTQVGIDSDWVAFACGEFHSLGLKTNGTIWSWGFNRTWNGISYFSGGQLGLGDTIDRSTPTQIRFIPNPPVLLTAMAIIPTQIDLSWTDLAFNETGFKVERKSGRNGTYVQIATVGSNSSSYSDINPAGFTPATYYYYRVRTYNAVGDSPYSNEAWAAISGNWAEVTCGSNHTIGLKTNGALWSWGYNSVGQLGLSDTIPRTTPSQIGSSTDWSFVTAGGSSSFAIKLNRTIWAWGGNFNGQLGLGDSGTATRRLTPTQIGNGSDWFMVSAGYEHTVAIKTNNTIWSWGNNYTGQLGLGYTSSAITVTTPTQIGNDTDWSKITVGGGMSSNYYGHTIAIKSDGSIWSWGNNVNGQLGQGDAITRTSPTRIEVDTDWSMVITKMDHNFAIKNNRTIWVWGRNNYGQLGLGDSISRNTPTQIGSLSDWSVVAVGDFHSLAIKTDKTLWSCGLNNDGQLGLGDSQNRNSPTQIGIASDWFALACGGYYSFGFKNGTLWAWGENGTSPAPIYGELGLGDTINRNIPTLVVE